jgi:hypothetical protein
MGFIWDIIKFGIRLHRAKHRFSPTWHTLDAPADAGVNHPQHIRAAAALMQRAAAQPPCSAFAQVQDDMRRKGGSSWRVSLIFGCFSLCF